MVQVSISELPRKAKVGEKISIDISITDTEADEVGLFFQEDSEEIKSTLEIKEDVDSNVEIMQSYTRNDVGATRFYIRSRKYEGEEVNEFQIYTRFVTFE
jgi:hypothetical protein